MPKTGTLLDQLATEPEATAPDLDTLRAELLAAHAQFQAADDRAREIAAKHSDARRRPREIEAALVVARRAEADALDDFIQGRGTAAAHAEASAKVERLEAERIALGKLLKALDGPGGERRDPFRPVAELRAVVDDARLRYGAALVGECVAVPDLRRNLLCAFAAWTWSRGAPIEVFRSVSDAGAAFERFLADLIERPTRDELADASADAARWLEGLPS